MYWTLVESPLCWAVFSSGVSCGGIYLAQQPWISWLVVPVSLPFLSCPSSPVLPSWSIALPSPASPFLPFPSSPVLPSCTHRNPWSSIGQTTCTHLIVLVKPHLPTSITYILLAKAHIPTSISYILLVNLIFPYQSFQEPEKLVEDMLQKE